MPIYKGATLEEALEHASIEENVDVQYLNYFVEKNTDKEVIIYTYFYSDIISYASNYVRNIIEKMGIKIEIKSIFENQVIKLKLEVSESSLIIGKDGATLQALTTLVRAAVAHEFKRHFHLLIDINSYKERKYDRYIKLAKKLADEVKSTRQDLKLDPMTSDERRLIHGELSKYPNIRTESQGEGKNRSIVIKYIEVNTPEEQPVVSEEEN